MTGQLSVDIEIRRGAFRLRFTDALELAGITAVFGASGSGKTSLLRAIAGLERAALGNIRFRDQTWLDGNSYFPPERRAIGYVFQDGQLFTHLNVRGNLLFAGKHGKRKSQIAFDEILDALDLAPLLDRDTVSLSGGETQLVAIGRALLAGPDLLLMDEPLSSLDRNRKRRLLEKIRSLPKRFSLPIIYVTHDLDELLYLADSVVLLADGANIARGSPAEIIERSDFVELSGTPDPGAILEADVIEHSATLSIVAIGDQRLSLPLIEDRGCEAVRLRIDPRDVIIAAEAPSRISIRNVLEAGIQRLDADGTGQLLVRLAVDGQSFSARITEDAATELGLAVGQRVFSLIKSVALEAFPRQGSNRAGQ